MPNDHDKVTRSRATRKETEEKIKEALAKKPGASSIARQGIAAQALTKMVTSQPDKPDKPPRVIRNGKHRNRTVRPSKVIRQIRRLDLIVTEAAPLPYSHQYQTTWTVPDKVDVSIIIPMYKSAQVVTDQIKKWTTDEGLSVELIYVDDCCPNGSKDAVLHAWNSQRPPARIICNSKNVGFGRTCNVGASYATGDFLIFLNADTTVTNNWIGPMLRLFDDPTVGIVGNLQIKEGGVHDGTIDSAGSEWCWQTMQFEHIGRHLLNGCHLENPLRIETAPDNLKSPADREMVTGCCIMIRKQLFDQIDGFNHNYRIGYWEDSEICCTIREMGYRIVYQPESVIYHKLSHSGSGSHDYQQHNTEYFRNKWVYSGRIDDIVTRPRPGGKPRLESILVCRLEANGDVLLASAVLPALRKKHPYATITFATACGNVLAHNPHLKNTIQFNHWLQASQYQLVVNLDMVYEYHPKKNVLDAYAEAAGVNRKDCVPFIHTQVPKIELPNEYAVIHVKNETGFSWVGRYWNNDRFADIAERLRRRGMKIVCVGSTSDAAMPADLDLRGKTSISELAHIVKHAKLFIGTDSMPMHIAQIFNVPGVAFFGSVLPEYRIFSQKMVPVNARHLPCIGCHHRKPTPCIGTHECERHDLACETEVTADIFWQSVELVLSEKTSLPTV